MYKPGTMLQILSMGVKSTPEILISSSLAMNDILLTQWGPYDGGGGGGYFNLKYILTPMWSW